ncbi:MAG: ParB N-terminal domain-containing protein [Desulfatiglans sp.]|nr:ParB N-terminal domain-containing protein [Desulfatiglans sp.]
MIYLKKRNSYPLLSVDIDHFSDQPGTFCMSYGFDNSKLVKSIDTIGLINHPCIIKSKNQPIEVITGYRRILALKELNVKEVFCFDLTDSGLTSYQILMFALHDNLYTRELNTVEKSMVIRMLHELVKDSNLICEVCSLIKVNKKDYPVFLKINMLDDSIKQYISNDILNIKIIESLIRMDKEDILLISNLVNKLKLSYSYQLQFIDYTSDISRIKKSPISILLNDENIQEVLRDEKKNIPQKAKEFMDYLRLMRNPNISRYKDIFEKKVKDLQLPENVRIQNPQFFESKGYRMEIDFNNGEELKKVLSEITDEKYNLQNIKDPWVNE